VDTAEIATEEEHEEDVRVDTVEEGEVTVQEMIESQSYTRQSVRIVSHDVACRLSQMDESPFCVAIVTQIREVIRAVDRAIV